MPGRTAAVAVILSLGAAALPASAAAALPSTKGGTDIVLGRSVGAVKIGQAKASARAAWGAGGTCPAGPLVTCFWASATRSDLGFAQFSVERSRVTTVQLSLGSNPRTKRPEGNTPLRRFATSKGIRLGSTLAALLRAYPRNTKFRAGDGTISDVKVGGPGRAFTVFTIRFGVVSSLRVDDGAPRG